LTFTQEININVFSERVEKMAHSQRIQKAQNQLLDKKNALLVEETTNLYYLTGQHLSTGTLLIYQAGADLLVDNRYFESCQKNAPCQVILSDQTSLSDLLKSPKFDSIQSIEFDSENTSFHRYEELKKCLPPSMQLVPINNPIKIQRMIKDQSEMDLLREAAALGSQGFDFVCSLLSEGLKESDIALELEIFWKRRGSHCLAFDPIIAFGSNSSMPHYRAGETVLKKGMSVLIDIGVNYQHYHSDMTRVVYFGEPDPQIRIIYSIVETAQKNALDVCLPGTNIKELDEAARDYIKAQGFGEFFTHSLGHGIGLEIHEAPIIRNKKPYQDVKLEVGMVITVEPGIYLPGIGGIRLEDTVLITENGHENLTKRPKPPLLYQ
jgi:Xaa-Pro aminopeptidase